MSKTENVIALQAATAPREPTRDDTRIIFEKLRDVYVDENVGYDKGWSDHRVSTDLGVPRKWVEDVRLQFFGKLGGNSEVEEFMAAYDATVAEAKAKFAEVIVIRGQVEALLKSPVWNEWADLQGRLTRLERSADALRKLTP